MRADGVMSSAPEIEGALAAISVDEDEVAIAGASGPWRWAPGVLLYGFVALTWMRTGVELADVVRFTGYWTFALVLPGTLVFRACAGSRNRLVEDLAFGAVTGIGLELVGWFLAAAIGVADFVRMWWLVVIVVFAVVPGLRRAGFARCTERVPMSWAWTIAFVSAMVVVHFDLSWFRSAPLPSEEGAIYHDMWWHLSLVHELARVVSPQIPQLVREPLEYHFFTHAHMGVASRSSGVPAEVVVFRLSMVPLAVTAVVVLSTLVRDLTGRAWAGALAVWLAFGTAIPFYVWPDLPLSAVTPLVARSPTQILALPYVLVLAWGVCRVLTHQVQRRELLWLALVLSAASATKPSVLPVIVGGLVTASVVCALWDRARLPAISALTGLGVLLQLVILSFAHGGGNVTVPRLVADLPPFNQVATRTIERAANDGLFLETIDGPRMLFVAVVTLGVFVGSHALWFGGLGVLAARSQRRALELWFLAGVLMVGFALTIVVDHVAGAQFYVWHTVSPLGIALTIVGLARLVGEIHPQQARTRLLVAGLGAGVVLSLTVSHLVRVRQSFVPSGALDRAVLPAAVLLLLVAVSVLMWRLHRERYHLTGLGGAVTLTALVGLALPAAIETNVVNVSRVVRAVEYPDPTTSIDYLSSEEAEALYWLAANSDPDDVIAANAWCRPLSASFTDPPCSNTGFWVTGLTGRRAVLDGYAYTTDALEAHMTNGLTFRNVPLFDERVDAVTALISEASPQALADLRRDYDLRWIVAMKRSGMTPVDLDELAELVFDNDGASIYLVD